MQISSADVKAKDVQLLLDIIVCLQRLLMGSQGHYRWLLGRCVDYEERLAVKEEMASTS